MITLAAVRGFALSFPETDEHAHFDKISFRVKKKIFLTLHEKEKRVVLKFTLLDQSVFCAFDAAVIYPVPGTWGKQGWTMVELDKIKKMMFKDAVTVAYCTVAPKKLADQYRHS